MAKDFSQHQRKIVERYYEHQETIRSDKLSDLVSELWLCENAAKATKLWGKAQVLLMKARCNPTQAAAVVNSKDVARLAELVRKIDAGTPPDPPPPDQPPDAAPGAAPGAALDSERPTIARGARSLADGRTIAQAKREQYAAAGTDSLEQANLKRALKAFRRKLKTLRREDESRLTGRYLTRGETSAITAITPPNEFPPAVWRELVRLGRLKAAGQGTYQLP